MVTNRAKRLRYSEHWSKENAPARPLEQKGNVGVIKNKTRTWLLKCVHGEINIWQWIRQKKQWANYAPARPLKSRNEHTETKKKMQANGPHSDCCCNKITIATLSGIGPGSLYWAPYAQTTTIPSLGPRSQTKLTIKTYPLSANPTKWSNTLK